MGEVLHVAKEPSQNDHIEENKGLHKRVNTKREPQLSSPMCDAKQVRAVNCQTRRDETRRYLSATDKRSSMKISRKAPIVQEQPLSTSSPSEHERTTDEGDGATRQHNESVKRTVTPLRGGQQNLATPTVADRREKSRNKSSKKWKYKTKSKTGGRRPPHRRLETPAPPSPRPTIEKISLSWNQVCLDSAKTDLPRDRQCVPICWGALFMIARAFSL